MEYIRVENGIISEHFCGQELPEGAIKVPSPFSGYVGTPTSWYDDTWQMKSELDLVKEGLKEPEEGYKLNEDKTQIVKMTDIEKMQAGFIEIPLGMKIENNELVEMTEEEQLATGLITQNDIYNREITELKAYLDSTDWIFAKCYELGISPNSKYPEECTKRVEARARINELEKLVK